MRRSAYGLTFCDSSWAAENTRDVPPCDVIRCLGPAIVDVAANANTPEAMALRAAAKHMLAHGSGWTLPHPSMWHADAAREALTDMRCIADPTVLDESLEAVGVELALGFRQMWNSVYVMYLRLASRYVSEYWKLWERMPPGLPAAVGDRWAPASGVFSSADKVVLVAALVQQAEQVGVAARALVEATLRQLRPVPLAPPATAFEAAAAKWLAQNPYVARHLYRGLDLSADAWRAGFLELGRRLLQCLTQ